MKLIKFLMVMVVVASAAELLRRWFQTVIVGRYLSSNNLFLGVLALVAPIVVVAATVYLVKLIVRFDPRKLVWSFIVLSAAFSEVACSYASANVQTLVSDDCGVTWTLVKAGSSVPARLGPCAYKVTVPDYPMPGETKFKTSFKDRVLAEVEVGYEYAIVDAKVFIGEAKYLGKPNADSDDASNAAKAYESAENAVIDKRLRDAATAMLIKEDIVDFSQAEFEDKLLIEVNERLKDKGVRLNFLSFVPTPEEQTRLAIDMMTAMKVYESRGLSELGQRVAVARASATKITIGDSVAPQQAQPQK